MKCLRTKASWKLGYIWKSIESTNTLTISGLNTQSLHVHVNDIVRDEDLVDAMILYIQETHLKFQLSNIEFHELNFNISNCLHGVLTCIQGNIEILLAKNIFNNIIELVLS